jgi:hypothetical protein
MFVAFFGATVRRPFFVLAAALCARRALLLLGLLCRPLVVPWTMVWFVSRFKDSYMIDRLIKRELEVKVYGDLRASSKSELTTYSDILTLSCSFLRPHLCDCRV